MSQSVQLEAEVPAFTCFPLIRPFHRTQPFIRFLPCESDFSSRFGQVLQRQERLRAIRGALNYLDTVWALQLQLVFANAGSIED